MTWHGTTENGVIVCTNGDRRIEALTTEPNPQNLAALIASVLDVLDIAGGDPNRVFIATPPRADDNVTHPDDLPEIDVLDANLNREAPT